VPTWAFPIDERKAKHEGFDANTVNSSMNPDDNYPGCPYCGERVDFTRCSCGKIGCGGGVRDYGDYREYTCPWCGAEFRPRHVDKIDVSGGGY
jgi:uncharacterized Zn-finger protein